MTVTVPAADVYGDALRSRSPLVLRYDDGSCRELPLDAWKAAHVQGDTSLLRRCEGATLDVGCGPGRLVVALAERGLLTLGVDIAPGAVRLARSRGALVLTRSVFATLPGSGRWRTALLADGNVGIGGDPVGLLRRLGELLAEDGQVLVELDPPGATSGPVRVSVEHEGRESGWFPWAQLSVSHAHVVADTAGFAVTETWTDAGRWFVRMERA